MEFEHLWSGKFTHFQLLMPETSMGWPDLGAKRILGRRVIRYKKIATRRRLEFHFVSTDLPAEGW